MCLITFSIQRDAEYPFVLIQNREEGYSRPSQGLHQWPDDPHIYAGRDQRKGGTWLGFSESARFATLLNHPFTHFKAQNDSRSRGEIPLNYLKDESLSSGRYLEKLIQSRSSYDGYHALFGTIDKLTLYSNAIDQAVVFSSGLHSVSNTLDDLSSFRKERASVLLKDYLSQGPPHVDNLITLFRDQEKPQKMENYPEELSREEAVNHASVFIAGETFGTVSTTALIVDQSGRAQMKEVRYLPQGQQDEVHSADFQTQ